MAAPRKKANAEEGPKAEYAVLQRLRHSHETYRAGDTVELSESEAAPLLDLKVIAPKAE